MHVALVLFLSLVHLGFQVADLAYRDHCADYIAKGLSKEATFMRREITAQVIILHDVLFAGLSVHLMEIKYLFFSFSIFSLVFKKTCFCVKAEQKVYCSFYYFFQMKILLHLREIIIRFHRGTEIFSY